VLWDCAQAACVAVILNSVELFNGFGDESVGYRLRILDRSRLVKNASEGRCAAGLIIEQHVAQGADIFSRLEH